MNDFDFVLRQMLYGLQVKGLVESPSEEIREALEKTTSLELVTIKPKKQKPEWMRLNA